MCQPIYKLEALAVECCLHINYDQVSISVTTLYVVVDQELDRSRACTGRLGWPNKGQ